ncbi:AraC-like DNA-binding protein [Bradyrhizobium sp. AZCC 2230]
MLNALSTAMFALVLRLASEAEDAPRGLLALAGHPRLAPALAALFDEPARAWSLPDLARLCNMSRATLAQQFQEKLGRSASDLLTDIRMTLAANELRKSSLSTGAVAEAVGYQSEAAFQRAFKSHMGATPAQWRKMQEPSGHDIFARPAAPADANPFYTGAISHQRQRVGCSKAEQGAPATEPFTIDYFSVRQARFPQGVFRPSNGGDIGKPRPRRFCIPACLNRWQRKLACGATRRSRYTSPGSSAANPS